MMTISDRRRIEAQEIAAECQRRMQLAATGVPSVGAIAVAIRQSGVCDVGERGVCYERYERTPAKWDRSTHPYGYSFIFESGRSDGFSLDDVRMFLTLTGEVCANTMNYQFRNVARLYADFRYGRFAAALDPKWKQTGPWRSRKLDDRL
jgi:hypothetical protein